MYIAALSKDDVEYYSYRFLIFSSEFHCRDACHYNYNNNPLSGLYLPYYPRAFQLKIQIRVLLSIIENIKKS
jgi:hypothetical protein